MNISKNLTILLIAISAISAQHIPLQGDISILVIRTSFAQDDDVSTTGDGQFLLDAYEGECTPYVLDSPPHDREYFEAHLQALDSYFSSVSKEQFGINILNSLVLPIDTLGSYSLASTMAYYNPYGDEELQELRLAELFRDALQAAYVDEGGIDFDAYDLITVVHAGVGQDFALPFLDPTPEDIASAYIDSNLLLEQLGAAEITFDNGSSVSSGIILPETQNHLLFDEADDIFFGASDPCEYQFALSGTWALMMGFAMGLPPLWDTESGESGAGVFALMDQGSNNGRGVIPAPLDAWSRIYTGWETATTVGPTSDVNLVSRVLAEDQIVRIDIGGSEYFLIENRNNWLRPRVDIDSLRWRDWGDENLYAKILIDSIGATVDEETGVLTAIPNYDYGLPNSGLLIWHVDEEKITAGLNDYTVNIDREHRGIDLEEADGAQDIGYPSLNPFFDPGSGIWSDMWYSGNSEYYYANPAFLGQPMSFGPDTYPDTRSNSGADTYISIDNISSAGDTMSFTIANSMLADGFPDSSLHIHFLQDFTGDSVPEIIGGKDSLWWSSNDTLQQEYFFVTPSQQFLIAASADEQILENFASEYLAYVGQTGDSLDIHIFSFESDNFEQSWSRRIEGDLPERIWLYPEGDIVQLNWWDSFWDVDPENILEISLSDSTYLLHNGTANLYLADENTLIYRTRFALGEVGGIKRKVTDYSVTPETIDEAIGLENFNFVNLSAVDLDLDGAVEYLTVDENEAIYVFNKNFTFESGFPQALNATSPILARDLFGDVHPELVVQVDTSDIIVLDWQGKEQYRLSNPKGSELRMLSQYQGKNCIVSESSIWLFDDATETGGNEWTSVHHDPTNSRYLTAFVDLQISNTSKLIDADRTYNYPNPATEGTTIIRVFVESAEEVKVEIYDLAGYFVERLQFDNLIQGEVNEVVWDVSGVESGVYFANVKATKGSDWENKIVKVAVVH